MNGSPPSSTRGPRPGDRHELLVAVLAAAVLYGLGSVFHLWALPARTHTTLDDLLVFSFLLLGAVSIVTLRRSRSLVREQALRADAEARFRALVEESPAIVYTWDAERQVHTYVSPQIGPVLGYTAEEWNEGSVWRTAIHPGDIEAVRRLSEAADVDPDVPFLAEYRVRTKDGRWVWVRDESRNVRFRADGRPAVAQGVIYDITERKEADERARAAEGSFRTLVERVPAVSYVWDGANEPGQAPASYISPQVEALLGYSAQDWIAHPERWGELIDPDDLGPVLAAWAEAVSAGRSFTAEYRIRHADGHEVWIRDEANPVGRGSGDRPVYQGVMFDVTERRRAEARLREAEERWRLLLEHLPVTAYMIEYGAEDSGIVFDRWIGPGITALVGITPDVWTSLDDAWREVLHPDDRDRVLGDWRAAVAASRPFEAEYRMARRDGGVVWVREESTIAVRDGRVRAEGVFIDITARHEAEEALRVAEQRFRVLVEELPAVMSLEDLSGGTIYIGPQIEEVFGYTPEEWIADPGLWTELLHPDDRDWVIAENDSDTGDEWSVDYRSFTREGRMLWVHTEYRLIRDEAGEPLYWLGILTDITDRKQAEERLRRAEERFRTLVEGLPVAVYTDAADEVSTALYVSPRYETLTGYTPEQRTRDPALWTRILHPDDRERVLAESERTNRTGEPFDVEYRIVAADGRTVWLHDHAVMVDDASGHPTWQGTLQDVSAQRMAQEALARRDAILEAAGFAAERFLRAGSWRDGLGDVLSRLGTAGGASRAYVYENSGSGDDEPTAELVRVWEDEDVASRDDVRPRTTHRWSDGFGRCAAILRSGEVIHGPTEGFPLGERSLLEAMGVTSMLAVPITVDGAWWGCIGFDRCAAEREWHEAEIEAVVVTANTLAATIERERSAAVLAETQRRFQTLVEQTPSVTYLDEGDTDGWRTVYLSPQAEEIFGVPMTAWNGDGSSLWHRLVHPDDREWTETADRLHYGTGDPLDIELRIVRPDGEVRWIRDQAVIVRDDEGRPRWSQGIILDVTAAKASEEALREAEERYRGIVEHVPSAIYLDVPDGSMRSVYMSPQIERIAGVTPERWLEEPDIWLTLCVPEDRGWVRQSYFEAASAQRPWKADYRMRTPDGRSIWVHDETTFLHDEAGEVTLLQGVLTDITERKLAEQALQESERREREAADRLRALDEMKNTFLAAVSHELRSPLTSILGLSLTLERAPDIPEADRSDLLIRLATNARKLDRLLKDLLDIDRLNRGIVEPQIRLIDVGAIARRTVESLDPLTGRDISVQADPVEIGVDPAKVERIVENLLVNATRHTEADHRIWLTVSAHDGGALITVDDDGPGVPEGIRAAIFEPFRQGPTASPHAPGTGIGLSLVARFAELHGGRAWVQEREGGGASFRVFLPDGSHRPAEAPPPTDERRGGRDKGAARAS